MTRDEARNAMRARIIERKSVQGSGIVMTEITKSIHDYPELNMMEKDLAFRSSIEKRSLYQWAQVYNCSYSKIYYMLQNPKVRALTEEIQFNIRKYAVGMQMLLVREAMLQYLKIFRSIETDDNMEAKRKAAKEMLSSAGLIKDTGEDGGGRQMVNINILGDHESDRDVSGDATTVEFSVDQLEREMNELRQLEDMRAKIDSHEKKTRGRSRDHGGGFEGHDAPDIKLE
jgi:hypothetical protein